MQEPLGDLAERLATRLTTDSSAPVQEASAITEEAALQDANNIFTKVRFSWRPEDRAALEQIRMSADGVFEEAFGYAITLIDDFYSLLWTPEVDGNGVVRRYANDRTVWKKGPDGRPLEDWNQLTGQDIEQALMNLQRLKLEVAPQVNQLFLEALYARTVALDVADDAWVSVMEGTQGDRTARANRASRQDRYHAYFRFYQWSTAKTFLDEITAFMRRLEKIRDWQTWGSKR